MNLSLLFVFGTRYYDKSIFVFQLIIPSGVSIPVQKYFDHPSRQALCSDIPAHGHLTFSWEI